MNLRIFFFFIIFSLILSYATADESCDIELANGIINSYNEKMSVIEQVNLGPNYYKINPISTCEEFYNKNLWITIGSFIINEHDEFVDITYSFDTSEPYDYYDNPEIKIYDWNNFGMAAGLCTYYDDNPYIGGNKYGFRSATKWNPQFDDWTNCEDKMFLKEEGVNWSVLMGPRGRTSNCEVIEGQEIDLCHAGQIDPTIFPTNYECVNGTVIKLRDDIPTINSGIIGPWILDDYKKALNVMTKTKENFSASPKTGTQGYCPDIVDIRERGFEDSETLRDLTFTNSSECLNILPRTTMFDSGWESLQWINVPSFGDINTLYVHLEDPFMVKLYYHGGSYFGVQGSLGDESCFAEASGYALNFKLDTTPRHKRCKEGYQTDINTNVDCTVDVYLKNYNNSDPFAEDPASGTANPFFFETVNCGDKTSLIGPTLNPRTLTTDCTDSYCGKFAKIKSFQYIYNWDFTYIGEEVEMTPPQEIVVTDAIVKANPSYAQSLLSQGLEPAAPYVPFDNIYLDVNIEEVGCSEYGRQLLNQPLLETRLVTKNNASGEKTTVVPWSQMSYASSYPIEEECSNGSCSTCECFIQKHRFELNNYPSAWTTDETVLETIITNGNAAFEIRKIGTDEIIKDYDFEVGSCPTQRAFKYNPVNVPPSQDMFNDFLGPNGPNETCLIGHYGASGSTSKYALMDYNFALKNREVQMNESIPGPPSQAAYADYAFFQWSVDFLESAVENTYPWTTNLKNVALTATGTEKEKAKTIYEALTSTIKDNNPATTLYSMDQVLQTQTGVCKHKASILNSLLKIANIESEIVSNTNSTQTSGHAWIRVNPSTGESFDLDPEQYKNYVEMPVLGEGQTNNFDPYNASNWALMPGAFLGLIVDLSDLINGMFSPSENETDEVKLFFSNNTEKILLQSGEPIYNTFGYILGRDSENGIGYVITEGGLFRTHDKEGVQQYTLEETFSINLNNKARSVNKIIGDTSGKTIYLVKYEETDRDVFILPDSTLSESKLSNSFENYLTEILLTNYFGNPTLTTIPTSNLIQNDCGDNICNTDESESGFCPTDCKEDFICEYGLLEGFDGCHNENICGNGIVETENGEECDDGYASINCSINCTIKESVRTNTVLSINNSNLENALKEGLNWFISEIVQTNNEQNKKVTLIKFNYKILSSEETITKIEFNFEYLLE